jgi:peptide chain release factor 1
MISPDYIQRLADRKAAIEAQVADPATAANRRKFQELVREHARLRKILDSAEVYSRLKKELEDSQAILAAESDPDLRQLAQEDVARLTDAAPKAERELMVEMLPPDPNDSRGVIVEIRAGTGGEEAALFAADLFRMYSRYAERQGWKVGGIDVSPTDIGGFKEIVFSIEGAGVFSRLRYEGGCHRVQRIPATEASGRIHTSAATVAVFPEVEETDDIEIKPDEIRVDIFCSSGPGGQGVNTTYSAVRITHLPTGLVAQSQDERSQHRNKEKALNVLKARLLDMESRREEEKTGTTRRSMIGTGDRSERIRTYNFPQNRVTDHRINLTLYTLNRVIEGELDPLVRALRDHDLDLRLRQETAAPA